MYELRRVGYPLRLYLFTGEGGFNHVGEKQNMEEEN